MELIRYTAPCERNDSHGFGDPLAILSDLRDGDMTLDDEGRASDLRRAYLGSLGIPQERLISLPLSHSRRVIVAESFGAKAAPERIWQSAKAIGGADGIVSGDPTLAVSITVADCMPIWIFHPSSGTFGLLHSGWKGTGILEAAVDILGTEFGIESSELRVIFGPAIGACCYAVPESRAAEFAAEFGTRAVRIENSDTGLRFFLDLRAANLALAKRLGLKSVTDIDLCTSCSPELGSYRRQGKNSFTRMAAICGYSSLIRAPASASSHTQGLMI